MCRNPYFSGLSFAICRLRTKAKAYEGRNPYFSGLSFAIRFFSTAHICNMGSQSLF